jgi:hypothetical protein
MGAVVWALHECERSKKELKHSTHDETHFGPRELSRRTPP